MSGGTHHVLPVLEQNGGVPPTAAPLTNGNAPGIHNATVNGFTPSSDGFKLGNFCIDEDRPMKVVVIGAGFSGIIAGIRFPQKIKNLELTIYDKNAGVGGTWYTNKYPGLACDIPAHCYQLTFEENPNWSSFYAPGPEIRAYLERVVDKFKLMRYIKLRHEVVGAKWDDKEGKWRLTIRRPKAATPTENGQEAFEEFEDTADFVLAGMGGLSRWNWPDIDGLDTFRESNGGKGLVVHSAQWEWDGMTQDVGRIGGWEDTTKDWAGKRVGVIGVGSSALQIVPSLQSRVAKVYNYVRGKTWLSPPFATGTLDALVKRKENGTSEENYKFTEEDIASFQDPQKYREFRHELESELNAVHSATIKGTPMQIGARAAFAENMRKKLAKKPWIADHIIPDFPVACRRLTPGPGYLEALCQDNVDFVTTPIKRVTKTGIELEDGTHHDLDVLVCATGYDTTFQYPFQITGRNNTSLNDHFKPHPTTYLTISTDNFPNWTFTLGPNSAIGSGSLLVIIERQVDYAVKMVRKMQKERIKSVEPTPEAVKDFDEYLEAYFPTTVYSEKCRSWYKMGKEEGRVTGLWPGSCLHAVRALESPRWEDFKYEFLDGNKNRFHWLGDGCTYNEKHMVGDRAWYLNDDEVDIPPVPEA